MGLFVAGLNPFLKFDEAYQSFTNLFVGQLTAGLSNARAYEAERKRAEALAEMNREFSEIWPNITRKKPAPADADAWKDVPNKYAEHFSDKPGSN